MKKTDLLSLLSSKTELHKKDCEDVLKAFAEVVIEKLTEDHSERIALDELGTFKVKDVPERSGTVQLGQNKGATWTKPAHSEITFKMSAKVKEI